MTNSLWPVNGTHSARSIRQTGSSGLAGATAARPLGARSGIRHGSGTIVTASSTTWTVKPHAGVLDYEAAAEAGPYRYSIDADQTGSVTAAHATYARKDIVWVRLDDPAESDGSSSAGVVAGYTAGTASASPAVPATPSRCMVLAVIDVPASGGGSPTVTMSAPVLANGGTIFVRNTTERTAATASATATNPITVWRSDAPAGAQLEVTADGTNFRTVPQAAAAASFSLDAAWAVTSGWVAQYVNAGRLVSVEGLRVERAAASLTVTAGVDYTIAAAGAIPAGSRPLHAQPVGGFIFYGTGTPVSAKILFGTDGSILVRATTGGTLAVGGANVVDIPPVVYPI